MCDHSGGLPCRATAHGAGLISESYEEKARARTAEEPAEYEEEDFATSDQKLGALDVSLLAEVRATIPPGELFEDAEFPCEAASLYYSKDLGDTVVWKRPKDLVAEPRLHVDGVSRHDIVQGTLGDCWFLSSCAALCIKPQLMEKVISGDQLLFGEGYDGLIVVRFWRFGSWVSVIIDDRLPCTRGGQLMFARASDPNEFWISLVEKAYAKMHGSFQAMEGGQAMDALVDLTGGLAERNTLSDADKVAADWDIRLFQLLRRAHRTGGFITASITTKTVGPDGRGDTEADEMGLVGGHAYTISNVVKVSTSGGEEKLVRVRNPWGNDTEWKGTFSDTDPIWETVDEAGKAAVNLSVKADGEFWMRFSDLCEQFQAVTVCNKEPDFDGDGDSDGAGHTACVTGTWEVGVSAGGCRQNMDKFATNPQFQLTLSTPDKFDPATDDPSTEGKCSVVVALMQEHRRAQRHLGVKMLNIAFLVYKATTPGERLPMEHFMYNYELGGSGVYTNLRETSARFELEPGTYVIVPATYSPDQAGSFMVRMFTESPASLIAT